MGSSPEEDTALWQLLQQIFTHWTCWATAAPTSAAWGCCGDQCIVAGLRGQQLSLSQREQPSQRCGSLKNQSRSLQQAALLLDDHWRRIRSKPIKTAGCFAVNSPRAASPCSPCSPPPAAAQRWTQSGLDPFASCGPIILPSFHTTITFSLSILLHHTAFSFPLVVVSPPSSSLE
ncbi:hypothetical protein NA56DRAFT_700960 [Hyaloscypha hepaticicola]|uniref:Uncharacterized protein n=1 Tax=Hyaloscypha hepaticicola TaxID=2082293 RepID=A0A2J6QBC4_9HELO|nr:hypothetical protein NA56DRAFT_700960 [Hyaloscypha hepaticicola]